MYRPRTCSSIPTPQFFNDLSFLRGRHIHKRMKDPKVFGPLIWDNFHNLARNVTTNDQVDVYISYVNDTIDIIPCDECLFHAKAYLKSNPPDSYRYISYGMYQWSVDFHNTVNRRLGKGNWTYHTM